MQQLRARDIRRQHEARSRRPSTLHSFIFEEGEHLRPTDEDLEEDAVEDQSDLIINEDNLHAEQTFSDPTVTNVGRSSKIQQTGRVTNKAKFLRNSPRRRLSAYRLDETTIECIQYV